MVPSSDLSRDCSLHSRALTGAVVLLLVGVPEGAIAVAVVPSSDVVSRALTGAVVLLFGVPKGAAPVAGPRSSGEAILRATAGADDDDDCLLVLIQ